MKRLLVLASIAFLYSCRPTENDHVSSARLQTKQSVSDIQIAGEPPLNLHPRSNETGKLSTTTINQRAAKDQAMRDRLLRTVHIPVRTANSNTLPITAEEAHKQYLSFLEKNKGDEIIPLFKQRYARVLLKHYNLIEQGDHQLIYFYTNQLSQSNSLDFDTMTEGLKKLKGHINSDSFNKELISITKSASQREEFEKEALKSITASLSKKESIQTNGLRKDFLISLLEREKNRLTNSTISKNIATLQSLKSS